MHKSKNIVHINTKAKRSQTSCLQEVWPFYSLTSVKDGIVTYFCFFAKETFYKSPHKKPLEIFSKGFFIKKDKSFYFMAWITAS